MPRHAVVPNTTAARPRLPLTLTKRLTLAVEAGCDPRTIDRAYRGEPIRGLVGERAYAALRAAGLIP